MLTEMHNARFVAPHQGILSISLHFYIVIIHIFTCTMRMYVFYNAV